MSQENFKKYFTLYFIIFGILISFFGAFSNYIIHSSSIEKIIDKKAKDIFEIKINTTLSPMIKNMDGIVEYLSKNELLKDYIVTKDIDKQKELENIFLALAGVEKKIMQLRIIDKDGKELIRVDRKKQKNEVFIVEKEKLQDKSTRDYFQKLSAIKSETIWHSKFNLNIENNKVEIPYAPTIRIAMPILKNSEFSGVVIVNLLTEELFNAIGKSTNFEHYIIDKDKNYILHPEKKYSFNKYKNIKKALRDDFPDGLKAKGVYTYSLDDIFQNEDKAVFILKSKNTYEKSLKDDMINSTVIVFLLTLILSFIMAVFASKKPAKLQISLLNAHKKLKEYTSIINRYIITARTDPDSTIKNVSKAFIKSSGYSKNELIGKKMNIIKDPDRDKSVIKDLWDTILSKNIWVGEVKNRRKDGTSYWLEQHVIPILNKKSNIDYFISIGIDVTAKKELQKLATTDKLTGIYNRRRVDEFLQIQIELTKRHSQNLSIIIIDIDFFKSVNDTYGHQVGDSVLIKTVQIISNNLRKSDIFGRYGGEEFIVICPQTNQEEAFVLAQKLGSAIENHEFETVGKKTISMGIAQLEDNDDEKTLFEKADKALYKAKNSGRNRAAVYI